MFLESFDKLEQDFKFGFDPKRSILPVSNQDILIDGSHRVALSIANKQAVYYFKTNV